MKRTLTNVFDPGDPWTNDHGTFYPVTGMFDDGSVLTANKKTQEAATELHGILTELIEIECDYYCDDKGMSAKGNQKWALKAILDAEGGHIYGKVPGGGGGASVNSTPRSSRTPEQVEDIRWLACLKAAANARPGQPGDVVLDLALLFYNFDFRAVAGPPSPTAEAGASESYLPDSAPATTSAPEAHTEAATGTQATNSTGAESSSAEFLTSPAEEGAGRGRDLDGEAGSCPPHDPDTSVEPKGMGRYPCRKCNAWVRA